MKTVKSVFRTPGGDMVYDPAEKLVGAFNKMLGYLPENTAKMLDHYAEEIVKCRLNQPNYVVEGDATEAMYHERGRSKGWGLDSTFADCLACHHPMSIHNPNCAVEACPCEGGV
jgi:hypothetical protein